MKVKVKNVQRFEVGDCVSFTVNGKEHTDRITYIDPRVMEGKVYDLTSMYAAGKLKKKNS